MHEQDIQLDHDDVDILLPWFVNGTLDDGERKRVQRHVGSCATCQNSILVLQSMQGAALKDSAVPIVPLPRTNDLMTAIVGDKPGRTPRSWWPAVALAASVMAVLLVAMLLINYQDIGSGPETRFETATSESTVASIDYVFAVEFEPGTTAIEREQAFDRFSRVEFVAEIQPNTYRVMVPLPASSLEELERLRYEMESHDDIRSVQILALQLPMR